MGAFGLALRNIKGNGFRSFVVFLCVMFISAFLLSVTLLITGAEHSLNTGIERLGADILVVPAGAETRVETALLMGRPTSVWMPRDMIDRVAAVRGVEKVTPQIYLQSLYEASCCSASEMFIVVFDPETDFVITPWILNRLGSGLQKGEVFGGNYIFVPPEEKAIRLYGSELTLKGNLEATGTGLDQTVFLTMETAQELARNSATAAERPLEVRPDSISTIMVKVAPGADPHKTALEIAWNIPEVVTIESPNLFGVYRQQMTGLLWGFAVIMIGVWAIAAVLIGLVFSAAANERRREIAVLRALGAARTFAISSILAEAAMLALGAGILGTLLAALGLYIFKDMIAGFLRMPFLFPSSSSFLAISLGGVLLSLSTVILAAFIPALRITRQQPAVAMRE